MPDRDGDARGLRSPDMFRYRLTTAQAVGVMSARFADGDAGCQIRVWGWIVAANAVGRLALAPLGPVLTRLANAAVRRGIDRATAEASEFSGVCKRP